MSLKTKESKETALGCGCLVIIIIIITSIAFSSCTSKDKKEKKVEIAEPQDINLQDIKPTDQKFKEELQRLVPDQKFNIEYVESTKYFKIQFKETEELNAKFMIHSFVKDSAAMMSTFSKNKDIDKVEFSKQVKMIDERGNESIETGVWVDYSKDNMSSINFKNWLNQLYGEKAMNFFILSDNYNILYGIRKDLPEKEQLLLEK